MTAGLNTPPSHLEEQLREALISLEQATTRERQTRLETEFLLESLRELGFSDRAEEVYQKSLTMLRESVSFSEAFILRQAFGGEPLHVVASTHRRFEQARFAMSPHFSRVKAGTVVPVFNIAAVADWQEQPDEVRAGVVSTLSVPVPQETGLVAIVCTSPDKGAFNAVSTTAVQRFGLLVSPALRMTRVREDELQSALVRLSSQAERDQTDFVLAAVDSLGEGVYVVDENNRIVVTNERYRQIYHPFADLYIPGINIKTVWQQEYESGFIADPGAGPLPEGPAGEALVAAEMNPSTWARTIRTRRQRLQDGRTIRATDRRLPNGWTVGVRFDISEVVQKEHDLTLARNEAEAANAVKTEFLATVSHEIRTPLNAILGMLGLIRRDPLSEDQREYISVAETSARNLLILLNDILDVSKMEAGKLTLEEQQVVLEQLLQEVVRLYSDAAEAKSLALNRHLDPAVPYAVRADAGRLRQVLINLTSNAIKFTDSGHVDLGIMLAQSDPGADDRAILRFEVSDTGPGIDPDARSRLFEPFEQIGAAVEKRQGGTGLGLNICRRIAEAMGGTVGLETKPGLGSTFWLEVELESANAAPGDRPEAQVLETAELSALTANVMSGDRESYPADGFTAVISKPFEERELLEAILNFGPAPEDRDPLAPLDAQSDEAHGIDLIVLDQLAERLGDGFTQTSVEIFTAEINQRLSAMAAVSGSGPASDDEAREQISREAHAIKGAAASYGLSALSALAAELEADPGRLDEVTPELTRLWSRAAAALDSWARQRRTQG